MKKLLATAKAMVGLLTLCALMAFALPIDAYAFPAKDVPIVMYHKVDAETPTIYWVSDDDFRDQMFLLHDLGYDTVDFDDLYNHIQDVTELPAKPIIVTFDDGYQGIYTYALPVMQEFTEPNFFGVAHITTDIIGDDEASRQLNLWDQPPEPDAWQMIWPEIAELYDAGWAIEAHSRTHAHLGGLSYEEKVYEAGARDVIAAKVSISAPNFYCYPFGESDSELITILQQAGYLGAMDASGGIENTSTTNLFHIRRTGIMRDDSLAQFASKIGETVPALPTLTVNTLGNGSVQINPDQPYYQYDTQVALTAVANPSWTFTSWSGDHSGSTNPDTITITGDMTVTANFAPESALFWDDFETGFGNWTNVTGDKDNWYRRQGSTPSSSTGPNHDNTLGNGWYAYMETSSGYCYSSGDEARLEGPNLDADTYSITLSFYYHMYGSNMGTLNVDVYDGSWHNGVWSISGQQHSSSSAAYTQATVDLDSYTGTIKIRFRGVAAGGYRGDMAIDDIEVQALLRSTDYDPPTPDPMTWETLPHATGSSSISMTATTASDASGVEYYFANVTDPNHDSGYQDSPTYTDTGLEPATEHSYQVIAVDKSVNQNATAWSSTESATTQAIIPGNTKNIMLTGYWPPSNEMLRKFSTDPNQNPDGWQGQNWEGRGYDIYAFFPEFPGGTSSNPKGNGDFEVDYQDVSQDFWRITDDIHPVAILSHGQGAGPWEIEYNARNLSSWSNDYQDPRQPTPSPPDDSVPAGYVRHSTLPVQDIADAIDNAGIGVDAWVDWDGNPGAFLCEYMAYHDAWYQSLHSDASDQYRCLMAGFTHVSDSVSINTATVACEIALRTTIDHLDAQLNPTFTLTINVVGNGTVLIEPNQATYDPNTEVTLTAIADEGATFNGWSGDVSGSTNPVTITMDSDKQVIAEFTDTEAPSPDPMTWATAPYATGTSSISMTASTATDESGVEYYFACVAGGGHDSGWQDSTIYEDMGLSPETQYTYQVKARDKSANQNETALSSSASATTEPEPADATPPSPDPMTWGTASPPVSTGPTSILMTASTASDISGVEYYFACVGGGGHDSGWQDSPTYEDTGLSPETQYTYQVKARDKSSNQNETGLSSSASAVTEPLPDTTPPSPDPMTWGTASPPAPTGPTSISMMASTASDISGVEYYFACVGGGGHDSGWQDSATYEDTGLSPDTQYTYTVTARDLSVNQNTTASSTAESATTDAGCIAYTTHVESIVFNNRVRCAPARYNGQVVVTVYDNCGDPVANADVTGTFTGDFSGTLSQTTDASGVAVITAEGCVKKPAYQFCVDNITHASLTYAPGDNVETCDAN